MKVYVDWSGLQLHGMGSKFYCTKVPTNVYDQPIEVDESRVVSSDNKFNDDFPAYLEGEREYMVTPQ